MCLSSGWRKGSPVSTPHASKDISPRLFLLLSSSHVIPYKTAPLERCQINQYYCASLTPRLSPHHSFYFLSHPPPFCPRLSFLSFQRFHLSPRRRTCLRPRRGSLVTHSTSAFAFPGQRSMFAESSLSVTLHRS